ncbi:MAG: glutamate-5-semialdehyde dehydrogenase [Oscillospiraceae bacterium]|jgi:glutamate-5-semialdehyde dehydrogenase|nr:glutamate-5-semialdehyde dehydrogenase [Oscillospiraceae bacterium]
MTIQTLGQQAQSASRALAVSSGAQRDAALTAMSAALEQNEAAILAANEIDMQNAVENSMTPSLQDRLRLTPARIGGMKKGVLELLAAPDPIGQVLGGGVRPNGLRIQQVSVPLGVIGMICEARPNVTVDAAALCLKSGNAVILRGGKDAINSNLAIAEVLRGAIASTGLPMDCVQVVEDTSRESARELMRANGLIDVLIPRGGAGLIKTVVEQSSVPVIETGEGVCHTYVDAAADLPMALGIAENAKCSRPSVCNAMETLLVHEKIAPAFLPKLAERLKKYPVELRCDAASLPLCGGVPATEDDWSTEYVDLILSVKTVASLDEALSHIARYGTKHSECIVTGDYAASQKFLQAVDAAAVYVNASTRFTDGGEFGLGAEIGIAARQKLHARGPLGLRHLTSYKYMIYGDGQVR